mmetsp:Transcript_36107/g.93095  ORF Transcript_36107/g.93095 Transcript_36107/m.93095 type:complete len:485 (+) Transcript_36107:578-2032(+)
MHRVAELGEAAEGLHLRQRRRKDAGRHEEQVQDVALPHLAVHGRASRCRGTRSAAHRHVSAVVVIILLVLYRLGARALLGCAQLFEELPCPKVHGERHVEGVLLHDLDVLGAAAASDGAVGRRAEGNCTTSAHGCVVAVGPTWRSARRLCSGSSFRRAADAMHLQKGRLDGQELLRRPRGRRRRPQLGLRHLDGLREAPVGVGLGALRPLDELVHRLLQPMIPTLDLLAVFLHVGHPALDHAKQAHGQAGLLFLDCEFQVGQHELAHLLCNLRVLRDHVGGEGREVPRLPEGRADHLREIRVGVPEGQARHLQRAGDRDLQLQQLVQAEDCLLVRRGAAQRVRALHGRGAQPDRRHVLRPLLGVRGGRGGAIGTPPVRLPALRGRPGVDARRRPARDVAGSRRLRDHWHWAIASGRRLLVEHLGHDGTKGRGQLGRRGPRRRLQQRQRRHDGVAEPGMSEAFLEAEALGGLHAQQPAHQVLGVA